MNNIRNERAKSPPQLLNGRVLVVDLYLQKWEEKTISGDVIEKYLCGRGVGAYLLSSFSSLEIKKGRPVVFAPGLLTGIIPFSSSCLSVIGDDNRLAAFSFSGYWGLELKMAGFDYLVIIGESTAPVMLTIRNEIVDLSDASGFWDQDPADVIPCIKDEQGDPWADLMLTSGAGAPVPPLIARSSSSPVDRVTKLFASKKLKAISVRGTRGFRISDPEIFKKELHKVLPVFSQDSISHGIFRNHSGPGGSDRNTNLQYTDRCPLLPFSPENSQIIQDCLGLRQKIDLNVLLELMKSITGLEYSGNQLISTACRIKAAEVLER